MFTNTSTGESSDKQILVENPKTANPKPSKINVTRQPPKSAVSNSCTKCGSTNHSTIIYKSYRRCKIFHQTNHATRYCFHSRQSKQQRKRAANTYHSAPTINTTQASTDSTHTTADQGVPTSQQITIPDLKAIQKEINSLVTPKPTKHDIDICFAEAEKKKHAELKKVVNKIVTAAPAVRMPKPKGLTFSRKGEQRLIRSPYHSLSLISSHSDHSYRSDNSPSLPNFNDLLFSFL